MKRILLSAFAILLFAATAMAAPISLPPGSPIFFQFNNMEQVSTNGANLAVPYGPAAGLVNNNWGVVNISSIQNGAIATPHVDISGGSAFFSDDGPGGINGQITGIFYGIQITGPTTATGGFLDLFWHDVGSDPVTSACLAGGCGPNAATVAEFTSGTFLARLQFASGIVAPDCTTTIKSTTDPTTLGGSGEADSFANVVTGAGGAWASILDGNWFNTGCGTRDIRFSNFFNNTLQTTWGGANILGDRSNDPARVCTAGAGVCAPVPEPATLTLLGLGLSLAGVRLRLRKRTNV
jgi:hypothetical protein